MLRALGDFAGRDISFEMIDLKPAVALSEDHPFLALCENVCRDQLGEIAPPAGVFYYSDAVIFSSVLGTPRVILGPGELGMSGSRDEFVVLDQVIKAAEIFEQIAVEYLGEGW